ncbi:MAG: tRNA lysidine(34) synthetase TilS, partial [Clostridia bacterium]|nr:tRNA lysidine(34) synthetase TilS [Clostridia bacterium]
MEEKVLRAIEKFGMLDGVNDVTVALSGGADSMCLLHSLLVIKDTYSLNITAAHLNHMIRGKEALRDEEFVIEQCKKIGVQLFVERVDVPLFARENKISIELAARQIRYDFFERVAKGVVATAHTASDNIETVILNLTRGASLKGLCGIPPKRDKFIRPLIYCTRADVEEFCKDKGIDFVTDSTNLSDEYTRNNIRHNVVPVLKQLNPSLEENIVRMCENLREDYASLEALADSYLNGKIQKNVLNLDGIDKIDKSIRKIALVKFVNSLNFDIQLNSFHLDKLLFLTQNSGKTGLPNNFSAICDGSTLRIESNDLANGQSFNVKIEKADKKLITESKKVNNLLLNNAIDCDKISGELVIRTRLPGDNIRLA